MAPVEVETIATTSQGVAFEVDVKSPSGSKIMTPVRKRLEERAANGLLPNLLFQRERDVEIPGSPVKTIQVAEKARAENERKRNAAERARVEKENLADSQRNSLEEVLKRAEEIKSKNLAEISSKAAKHFEEVKLKAESVQTKIATAALDQDKKIKEVLEQSGSKHEASVAERIEKASRHNDRVATKLEQHSKMLQQKTEELRERAERKAQRQAVRVSRERSRLSEKNSQVETANGEKDIQVEIAAADGGKDTQTETADAEKNTQDETAEAEKRD